MEPANPHNALLFSNLGTIQRRQHRYEQALDSYTLALNIAPRAIPALMNRAALYLELGKDDLARIDYSLVLDIESDNQEALLMRAYIYMRQRNYNFAKSDYERLLKLAPQSYNGRLGLATLEQKEGKYEAALSILNGMIAEKGGEATRLTTQQYAVLYVARAGVEQDMKHVDLAMMDLEEAIKLDASQTEAYLIRGKFTFLKEKELAKRDFERPFHLACRKVTSGIYCYSVNNIQLYFRISSTNSFPYFFFLYSPIPLILPNSSMVVGREALSRWSTLSDSTI